MIGGRPPPSICKAKPFRRNLDKIPKFNWDIGRDGMSGESKGPPSGDKLEERVRQEQHTGNHEPEARPGDRDRRAGTRDGAENVEPVKGGRASASKN